MRWKPSIGDIVYITPMFRAIKATHPDSQLYVVGAGRASEVVKYNPDINEFIDYKMGFWRLISILRKKKIDFACLANAGVTRGLALLYLAGIPAISVFSDEKSKSFSFRFLSRLAFSTPIRTGTYIPSQYLNLLDPIRANTGDAHFRLYFSKEAGEKIDSRLIENGIDIQRDFLVGIAPGGSTPERWWPAERFAVLAKILAREYGARIVLLGAGIDKPAIDKIANDLEDVPCVNFYNQNLDEFKATVSKCSLIIGNDSGPMVTADAFNVPNLVLIGPTDEREYHLPPGPVTGVIRAVSNKVEDITLEMVIKEADRVIKNIKNGQGKSKIAG